MEYGKLDNGRLTYVRPTKVEKDGITIYNPSESVLNSVGIYRIVNIAEDGVDAIEDGVIKHYIGQPAPNDGMDKMDAINARLDDMTELTEALERIVASMGVTEADREMANERIQMRNELGKTEQTAEGDGTDMNPFKYWKEGMRVNKGDWWMTEDGYLWEAVKSGVPSSSTDSEYWDVV